MIAELSEVAAGLPFALSVAGAGGAGLLRSSRRRSALNEAVHELRRPLQALALALPPEAEERPAVGSSLRMAAVALDRLERQVNGRLGAAGDVAETIPASFLAAAAVDRCQQRARWLGGSVALRWGAGEALVRGCPFALSQALDNMITNGLEHGGPRVRVEAARDDRSLILTVRDDGAAAGRRLRQARVTGLPSRLTGRSRRGHGLRVVRRAAAAHGGAFRLRRTAGGSEAELVLPLAVGEP